MGGFSSDQEWLLSQSLLLIMVGKFRYQLTLAAAAFNASGSLPPFSLSLSLFMPLLLPAGIVWSLADYLTLMA